MSVTRLLRFSLIFLVAALTGCRGYAPDPRLSAAADSIDVNPKRAAELIEAVDPASLRADDRHYRDLLTIKAADKAYVTHKSDTTILRLIDWARGCGNDHILTEALYYGGRVYADLGDYPTALRYYQDALDRLPPDNSDINLRANVLSQTGFLLYSQKLYQQAIPYYAKSIAYDYELSDTFGIINDLDYLSQAYIGLGDYDAALHNLQTAYHYALEYNEYETAMIQVDIAKALYLSGKNEAASSLLYKISDRIQSTDRLSDEMISRLIEYFHAIASEVFYKTGDYHSAFLHAMPLTQSEEPARKVTGYKIVLKPELRKYLSTDSIDSFFSNYREAIDTEYNQWSKDGVIEQTARYNYSRLERDNTTLSRTKKTLVFVIFLLAISVISLAILSVILARRLKDKEASRLHMPSENLETTNNADLEDASLSKQPSQPLLTEDELRESELEKARNLQIHQILEKAMNRPLKEVVFWRETEAYEMLYELIKNKKGLNPEDKRWNIIFNCIENNNPAFFITLQQIANGKLSKEEKCLASMIMLGFGPSDASTIFSKAPGTITYWRKGLVKKIFSKQVELEKLDELISSI